MLGLFQWESVPHSNWEVGVVETHHTSIVPISHVVYFQTISYGRATRMTADSPIGNVGMMSTNVTNTHAHTQLGVSVQLYTSSTRMS